MLGFQYERSRPSGVAGEDARPRIVGAVRSYADGLVDGGHLVHKDGAHIFGAVLLEIRRILEPVDVEGDSHETRATAIERRFHASCDLVGQRSLEVAEVFRQLRLLRYIDVNDGLAGELKRVGHFVAKQCFDNYAAAAVGLLVLQYGMDSVLVDSLALGHFAAAGKWRRILCVE